MKTLLLVDASSYLYRAFFALPNLKSPAGQPTGAVYGVVTMLRRLRKEYAADYSACIFDAKGKTFRHEQYPEYKAHRPSMPEELACQITPLHEIIRNLGWPLVIHEGVEADDVIGTLAKQGEEQGLRVLISTGDKDLAQLVSNQVLLVDHEIGTRGKAGEQIFDRDAVVAKFGVPPERMTDYLALVGDTSDNIPGVPGIGPKTARKLLETWGDLQNLLAHMDNLGGSVAKKLQDAAATTLPMAHDLVTIRRDIDLGLTVESLEWRQSDEVALRGLYEELGFRRLLEEMGDAEEENSPQEQAMGDYIAIVDEAGLDIWLERLTAAPLIAFDTETTGLDEMRDRLVGLSFSIEPGTAAYLPLAHTDGSQLDMGTALAKLRPILGSPDHPKVGQNLKFDKHILANHGIDLRGIREDTLLESYVLESHNSHDLDSLALRHLNYRTITYEEVAGKGKSQISFSEVAIEQATAYAAEDADIALRLHRKLAPEIEAAPELKTIYRDIEMPLIDVLVDIERHGMLVDCDRLAAQHAALGKTMEGLLGQLQAVAGESLNPNSSLQVRELLFDRIGLKPIKKTPGGVPSTDEDVLSQLAAIHPVPDLILRYRGVAKLRSTYTGKLPSMVNPDTGRVHTRFNQAVAVTGRLSSADPNLQNIPIRTEEGRRIRTAFVAPPGHCLVSADYSQVELRIMAHLADDPGLKKAFAAGQDIHRATAAEIFGLPPEDINSDQRRFAKTINFGLIYGMSPFGLAKELSIDRRAAQDYMDRYFNRYPRVAEYMDATRQQAAEKGYVSTAFGRRLYLPDIKARNAARRAAAERAAVNAPMQGTAADIIKLAMISVHRWLKEEKLHSRLVLQVHDELVLEVPDGEAGQMMEELPKRMAAVAAGRLSVPLIVDVGQGQNWEEAH